MKKIKIVDSYKLAAVRRLSFSFTYTFKFPYFCTVDTWTLKKEFY